MRFTTKCAASFPITRHSTTSSFSPCTSKIADLPMSLLFAKRCLTETNFPNGQALRHSELKSDVEKIRCLAWLVQPNIELLERCPNDALRARVLNCFRMSILLICFFANWSNCQQECIARGTLPNTCSAQRCPERPRGDGVAGPERSFFGKSTPRVGGWGFDTQFHKNSGRLVLNCTETYVCKQNYTICALLHRCNIIFFCFICSWFKHSQIMLRIVFYRSSLMKTITNTNRLVISDF